jgi:hypothetical protein
LEDDLGVEGSPDRLKDMGIPIAVPGIEAIPTNADRLPKEPLEVGWLGEIKGEPSCDLSVDPDHIVEGVIHEVSNLRSFRYVINLGEEGEGEEIEKKEGRMKPKARIPRETHRTSFVRDYSRVITTKAPRRAAQVVIPAI